MHSFIPVFKKIKVPEPKKKGITITVSGLSGSGKTTISKYIAEKLDLKYFSAGGIMRADAKKEGLNLVDFLKGKKTEDIHMSIDKKIIGLSAKGGCVLDGRLTGWAAGSYADIRVFISASKEDRYLRISRRDGIAKEEAMRITKMRDETDRENYKKLYGIDLFDTSIYTIVVDTTGCNQDEGNRRVFDAIMKVYKNIAHRA